MWNFFLRTIRFKSPCFIVNTEKNPRICYIENVTDVIVAGWRCMSRDVFVVAVFRSVFIRHSSRR